MKQTLIEYVISRLNLLGITNIFGVPGDYSFPINGAICEDKRFRWIGTCNELNASYAAGGYARIKGLAALCTTQGVGELSAINGIAGAYSEYLPIFHLVGMQPSTTWKSHVYMHHTLGTEEHDVFFKMSKYVYCAQAILTPENCISEMERLIGAALYNWRPVYIGIPKDYASSMIQENVSITKNNTMYIKSDSSSAVRAVVTAIVEVVQKAKTVCILPGILISRLGLYDTALALLNRSGLVFASTPMDKGVLDEMHPSYIGMYFGHYGDPEVYSFVESCNCILNLGVMMTEINTGRFTSKLDFSKVIDIMHHHVRIGSSIFQGVEMKDVLQELAKHLSPRCTNVKTLDVRDLGLPKGSPDDPIKVEYLYPRLAQFFKPADTIIVDVGTSFLPLIYARLPARATFHNSSLWASIGWATPAAFGASLANSEQRRTILITGDGAHQMSVQEISQFPSHRLKPIIFVLNNGGYLIERIIGGSKIDTCNDVASWDYHELPKAFGCSDWFTAKVTTCGELDQAMRIIERCETGAYIEIVTGREFAAFMSEFYRLSIQMLH